jgi:hypothetical protein
MPVRGRLGGSLAGKAKISAISIGNGGEFNPPASEPALRIKFIADLSE